MQGSSQVNNKVKDTEQEFATYLYKKGFLKGPGKCQCNCENFSIQNDNSNKTSGCIFRCLNYKCRKKYSVRINSLFELFPYNSL